MEKTTTAGVETMLYSCPECGVYFEAYSQAFRHLKVKHDLNLESAEIVKFLQSHVPIERLNTISKGDTDTDTTGDKENYSSEDDEDNVTDPDLLEDLKKKGAVPDPKKGGGGRVEIKLDDLKASESETLMEDSFQIQSGRPSRTRKVVLETEKEYDYRLEGPSSPSSSVLEEAGSKKKRRTREGSDSDLDYSSNLVSNGERSEEEDECQINEEVANNKGARQRSNVTTTSTPAVRRPQKSKKDRNLFFQCRLCPGNFDFKNEFSEHLRTKHLKNGVYTCCVEGCGRTFPTIKRLHKHPHLMTKKAIRYDCPHCGMILKSPEHLKKHLRVHKKEKGEEKNGISRTTRNKRKGRLSEDDRYDDEDEDIEASEIETMMEDSFQIQSEASRPRRTRKVVVETPSTDDQHDYRLEGPSSPSSSVLQETTKKKRRRTRESSESDLDYEEESVENSSSSSGNEDDDEEYEGPEGSQGTDDDKDTCPKEACGRTFKHPPIAKNKKKGGKDYECPQCGGKYGDRYLLNRHLKRHENAKMKLKKQDSDGDKTTVKLGSQYYFFPCRLCPETFTHQHRFIDHMTTNHLKHGVYTCPKEGCGRTFPTIRRFNKHPHVAKNKNRIKLYECPQCGGKYQGPFGLKKHLRMHENEKKKPPPKPLRTKFIHPERAYKCPVTNCPKSFDVVQRLRRHFVLHLENNPFVCKISGCGRKFSSQLKLKDHIQLHIGEKRYKCDKCDFAYVSKGSLVSHIKEFHEADRGHIKRPCKTQRPSFKRLETDVDFTRRESTSTADAEENENPNPRVKEEEEFLRIEVGSQHFDDTNLELGETTPTTTTRSDSDSDSGSESDSDDEDTDNEDDEESQEALGPVCSTLTQSLKNIISTDPVYLKLVAENPNVATLLLPTKGSMHTVDYTKVFKCTFCDWETVQRWHLGLHMKKVHGQVLDEIGGLKPIEETSRDQPITTPPTSSITFLCGKCGHSSTSPADLTAHMKKEHPDKMPYACAHCTMRFKYSKTLKTHEKTVHFPEKKPEVPEKKHGCPHCPAQYSLRGSLHGHIARNHTCKIMCKICKREINKVEFPRHLKRCNKTSRVTCKLCGQTTANNYTLQRHIKAVHLEGKNGDYENKPMTSMSEEQSSQEENGNQDLSQESQSDKDNQILGL